MVSPPKKLISVPGPEGKQGWKQETADELAQNDP
jgi:hypothetical protein